MEKGLHVLQYDKIRVEGVEDLKALKPDLMITCAFGQILSQEIIDIAKIGVFNIHASLLPKYRGASPINEAILRGEKETGVTIMRTDIGIDTGDIIYKTSTEIKEQETAGELSERLSVIGANAIEKVVLDLLDGKVEYVKQPENDFPYTRIIKKEDAKIDFNEKAEDVANKVRAYNPAPVAYATLNGEPFKIYKAKVSDKTGDVGKVLENEKKLIIGCKDKSVEFLVVQKCGGKPMNAVDFLRGNRLELGKEFK
ncbi:MAG: methionyl-tRNA formyltransferase [Clostridia bacterium]|nr:methionyl-tRNA formyltransferase [Clostridia bacterium]